MARTKPYTVIGEATDPDERIRLEWAESLREAMAEQDINVPKLRSLLHELGVGSVKDGTLEPVSRQTVEAWVSGKWAPRPHVQAALGTIFGIPARILFPIKNLPRKAA